MTEAVDLTARTGGLLPIWAFFSLIFLWIVAVALSFRYRSDTYPGLPHILASIGALTLGNVLFFWRPLFTDAHMPAGGGDLNSFFFTLHAYSAQRIRDGELPLWNPNLHGGMPHLGNYQAGVLYPPNLISYVAASPFSYGTLEWLAILHFLIASIGLYLILRSLRAGYIGAVAGGLVFAYSGFMVAHLGHYSMITAAAWVPWLFWAVHRLVRIPSWRMSALLAGFVFLTATAGHQQTLLFAMTGTGLWWLFLIALDTRLSVGDPFRERLRTVWDGLTALRGVQFVGAAIVGLALAAPMILPSLQLARRSVRSTLTYDQSAEFSVQPVALLQLILPTVFGSNPTDHWGAFASGEIWGYMGVVTLVLAVIAVLLRPSAHRVFFGVMAIAALLFAVGPWSPIHGWVYQFAPLFDLVRAPARSYLFLNLAVAALAGLAISDLSASVRHQGFLLQRTLTRAIQALVIIVGVVALFVLPLFYSRILGVDDPSNRPVITVDNLQMLLLFLLLLLAVLWMARKRVLRGVLLAAALAALVVIDLFSATMPFNPTDQDLVASYREPGVTAFLEEAWEDEGPFRIDTKHPGLLPNFGAIDGFHVAAGVFDPMQPAAYTTMHNVLAENPEQNSYDMLNVRYWLTDSDNETPTGFEAVFETEAGTVVLERENALPRAWFVSDVVQVQEGDAIDHLREPEFDPSNQVLLADPPVMPDGNADGEVRIVRYQPERVELEVTVDGDGYLVLADGDYPGWNATVDGEEAPILLAYHGMRAVPVDETAESVVFRYEPSFITAGTVIALLGVLAIAGTLIAPILFSGLGSNVSDGRGERRLRPLSDIHQG